MKGIYVRINTDGTQLITPVGEPTLESLREGISGGYLEAVPYFDVFEFFGKMEKCVAFCDEEGKLKNLPVNGKATEAWYNLCLKSRNLDQSMTDVLVGPVLIVMGDKEFMEAL